MSDPKENQLAPAGLKAHERPLGRFHAESHEAAFAPLRSLEEAKQAPDGIVILQGDDGGQIYVVCPASQVACNAQVLAQLLQDLDAIAWPENDPSMRRVFFERLPAGAVVAGGMGGGRVEAGPWIHEAFVRADLADNIRAVLSGSRASVT